MIFKKLTLHNFGLYAGDNTFNFTGKKPIVLIGGMNGYGKTTFLESILLVLYGANSFAVVDSKYPSYTQYLKEYINIADGSMQSFIELEFLLEENPNEVYKIKRAWKDSGKIINDTVSVYVNNMKNTFITNNWNMFIENILPSALSKFFIFDGEKIILWADESNNKQIKESIFALLGITVLDNLNNDLNRIVSKNKINEDILLEDKSIKILQEKIKNLQSKLVEYETKLDKINKDIEKHNKEIEDLKVEYNKSGGDVDENRHKIVSKKQAQELELVKLKEKNIDLASRELPLLMLEPLFDDVMNKAIEEIENRSLKQSIKKIKNLSKTFLKENKDAEKEDLSKFIDFLNNSVKNNAKTIFNLSENDFYKMENLKTVKFIDLMNEYKNNKKEHKKIEKKIHEFENMLNLDINPENIEELNNKINIVTRKLKLAKTNYDIEYENYMVVKRELNATTSTYDDKVGAYLSKVELSNDSDRVNKYTHMAMDILKKYKERIIQERINDLSQKMTTCFKKLIGKKKLVSKIEIDHITLDFIFYDYKKQKMSKKMLSAGEKQLVIVALLWSLGLSAEKHLPVIIDTPLSRLDTVHRFALVKNYFPNASNQTIILSTDSEIDKKYYDAIKSKIKDEFTLKYDEEKHATEIEVGYFKDSLL